MFVKRPMFVHNVWNYERLSWNELPITAAPNQITLRTKRDIKCM